MKRLIQVAAISAAAIATTALLPGFKAGAQGLVLLHTNDTHSALDADPSGRGGILARKAMVDSVRQAEENVLLIDAGDMVQGTLYFKLFGGEVEYPVNNMMGYDIRIPGNHEFDNGLDAMARYWSNVRADRLSANYDFSHTAARGLFKPYVIKKIGGKKVGFIGLNTDPESLIVAENYEGMKYEDPIAAANRYASELKRKGCDLVVAVTHIGYSEPLGKPDDLKLAASSRDIDIIIGGHSHTIVDPSHPEKTPHWVRNADGRDVLVTQTGKYGKYLGYIKLDLADHDGHKMDYRLLPVAQPGQEALKSKNVKQISDYIAPYRAAVDSLDNVAVAWSVTEMPNGSQTGAYPNWTADFAVAYCNQIADSLRSEGIEVPPVDLGIMNVGGIRQPMARGVVTEGQVMATFPFANRLRLIFLRGGDLEATMRIAAQKGGESVSREVSVLTDPEGHFERMYVNGREVDPDRWYTVATIDYVAEGNDDMTPMKNHREIWRDRNEVYLRVLDYLRELTARGESVSADPTPRFKVDSRHMLGK